MSESALAEGRALVDDARAQMFDRHHVRSSLQRAAPALAGGQIMRVEEITDSVADLILRYTFDDGSTVIAKRLLPVVKADPQVSFAELGDRGLGIDLRMNLFRDLLPVDTGIRSPRSLGYDSLDQTVWMEDLGVGLATADITAWQRWLVPLGVALKAVHAYRPPADTLPLLEDARRRDYLVSYPLRSLQPYLDSVPRQRWWSDFLELNERAPRALVHGDLAPKNCVCDSDRRLWLLDFDRSNIANPAYDIGLLFAHLFIQVWDAPAGVDAPPLDAFWEAYIGTDVGADFLGCVRGYIALLLAYRLGTLGWVRTRNARIGEHINKGLQRLLSEPLRGAPDADWAGACLLQPRP